MQKSFLRRAKDRIAWTAYRANWASHVKTRREPPARRATPRRSQHQCCEFSWDDGLGNAWRRARSAIGDLCPRFAEDLEAAKTSFVEILHIGRIPVIELFENVTHG